MTTPFESQSWPSDPTGPSSPPAGYVAPSSPSQTPTEPILTSAQVSSRRAQFYELIFRQLVAIIQGFFIPGSGTGTTQLTSIFANIPIIGQPISSAINFITSFLDPAKLLFSQNRVQNPPQSAWPKSFAGGGFVWGELTATPIQLLVQNLSRTLTPGSLIGGNLVSTAFALPSMGLQFITSFLKPQNQLATLTATGLVPDSQKPQAVQDIVDHANNAFLGNPIGALENFAVTTFWDVIGGIFHSGSNAQSVNIIQNSQLDAITAGGSGVSETFDGASSTDLGANFVQLHFDSGSGTCGRDGNGNAHFNNAGSSASGFINRHVTALASDTQKASIVLNSNLKDANVTDSAAAIQVRMKSDFSERVEAWIYHNAVEIGYVVGGVYTRLGAITGISGNTAGVWELKAGTDASTREFILYYNGGEVIRRTDSLAASAMGVNNRFVAFTMFAGVSFFWVYAQATVPDIGSMSGSDRLSSS